ncbi:MAG: hypothetical protein IIC64_07155 [SAR324 cluster bacterium]|nr:hypothetical protein [SAR324 cluster bacterium]
MMLTSLYLFDSQHVQGAIQLGAGVPGAGAREHIEAVELTPTGDLADVAGMDGEAHLDREGPERLNWIALAFETLETLDFVGILEERDVRTVISLEFP